MYWVKTLRWTNLCCKILYFSGKELFCIYCLLHLCQRLKLPLGFLFLCPVLTFCFSWRLFLKQNLSVAILSAIIPCYYEVLLVEQQAWREVPHDPITRSQPFCGLCPGLWALQVIASFSRLQWVRKALELYISILLYENLEETGFGHFTCLLSARVSDEIISLEGRPLLRRTECPGHI